MNIVITDELVAELECSVSHTHCSVPGAVIGALLAERAELKASVICLTELQTAVQSENDELKRDAERYRWLRSSGAECNVEIPLENGHGYLLPGFSDHLDTAIDAAMLATQ